eukprot:336923-Prorocentrum_lima.AAC.1
MTSSLVGSEMCIRDRILCPLRAHRCLHLDQVESWALELLRLHRCVPVSYTHLTLPTICSV